VLALELALALMLVLALILVLALALALALELVLSLACVLFERRGHELSLTLSSLGRSPVQEKQLLNMNARFR
jgi:hypothetical protein